MSNLSRRVEQLQHILSESQYGSGDAIKAARAYKDIVAAVRSAREAADSAQNNTNDAADILYNVQEKTNEAEVNSTISKYECSVMLLLGEYISISIQGDSLRMNVP